MAGSDLDRVVDMLRSARLEEQLRVLRAGTLLAELRSAVSAVHSNGTVSKGTNQRLMFCIQSQAAALCELLDAVLHARIRAEQWHQVPAVLWRHRSFRSAALRDLGQFLDRFRSLAAHVADVQTHFSMPAAAAASRPPGGGLPAPGGARQMVGRSGVLEKVVSALLVDRTRLDGLLVVPVVGGPGVGKTRLATALLHDGRVRRRFGVRLAVPVTRDFRLDRTLMLMIPPERRAELEGDCSLGAMAAHVGRVLREGGGDYLIVLDDVWGDKEGRWLEMGALMRSLPWNGAVVVTTRTPDVAAKLVGTVTETARTNMPVYLQPLEPEFWSWFVREWAGAEYAGDWPRELLGQAGARIVERCGGVPLLLDYARTRFCQPQGPRFWRGLLLGHHAATAAAPSAALGPAGALFWRDLLARIDELPQDMFWQRFLGELQRPDTSMYNNNNNHNNSVLQSAAASYQHLPFDMRSCLSYCSMFPSDHGFDFQELSDLLAAQGYIPPVIAKAQQKTFLQQLLDECFYPLQEHEYGDRCVYRMHRVMHIFAQHMDRGTTSVLRAGQGAATQFAHRPAIRRASLIVNPLTASFPASLFECRELGALVLIQQASIMCPSDQQPPRCEISEIPQELFHSLIRIQALSLRGTKIKVLPTKFPNPYHVKYLNLSLTDIEIVPSSISRLMFLQTLVLSHCHKLQKLHPNITKLSVLQKLDLEGCCSLVDLPQDFSKMSKLEYLNVRECSSLTQLPGRIGQMQSLQILLGYIASHTDGSSMSELLMLTNLHSLSMQSLEKVSVSDLLDVRLAKLDYKTNLSSLSLRWNADDSNNTTPASAVLESLRPHWNLKALEIVAYDGKNLPTWMIVTRPYLVSLVEIRLINLRSCENLLPPLGLLPSLKIAEISGAETICSVKDNFYGQKGTFPSLEKLTFSYMHNLDIWEKEHRPGMFPRLAELAIIQCPKLRALQMELPALEKLILWMNNNALYGQKGALRGVAKNLEHVSISFCEELLASSNFEALHDLGKLTKLEICECDQMACLPQGLQYISSIRTLTIENCNKLETLPDWLENLPSLQIMRLSGCPMLHYIPGGLQERPGIIIYVEDCPNLLEEPFHNFQAQSTGKPIENGVNKGK